MSGFQTPAPTNTDWFNILFFYDPTANGGTGGGGSSATSVNYPVAQGLVSFPDGIELANDIVFVSTTATDNDIVGANSVGCSQMTLSGLNGSTNSVSMNADPTTNTLLTVNGNLKVGNGSLVATNFYSATGSTNNSINMLTTLSGNTGSKTGLGVYYNLNGNGEVDLVGMGNVSGGGFSFYQSNASSLTNQMNITSNGVSLVNGSKNVLIYADGTTNNQLDISGNLQLGGISPTLLSTNTYGLVSSQGLTIGFESGSTNSVLILADGTTNNQLDISGNLKLGDINPTLLSTNTYGLVSSQGITINNGTTNSVLIYADGTTNNQLDISGNASISATQTYPQTTNTSQLASISYVNGAISSVPTAITGTIIMYTGTTAPTGYLFCDGSQVSTTTYAALYALIGSLYANGATPTTGNFFLPNFESTMPIGSQTTSLTGITIDAGQNSVVYFPNIYGGGAYINSNQLAPHSHSIDSSSAPYNNVLYDYSKSNNTATGGSSSRIANISSSSAYWPTTTGYPNNFGNNQNQGQYYPPFCAVNFIIKT
jgi:microcystin-dependent protein